MPHTTNRLPMVTFFARVKLGVMYVIKDFGWQPSRLQREKAPKTTDLLRNLQVNSTLKRPIVPRDQALVIEQTIESVRCLYTVIQLTLARY